jgi:ribose 5-phosphate isomerase B
MFDEKHIRNLVRQALRDELGDPGSPAAESSHETGPVSPEPTSGASANNPATSDAIALGADHGGFRLKEALKAFLVEKGWRVDDCGTHSTDSVDYPDLAHAVARKVASGACRWGVIVDGAGIGSCMAANKVPGVRAALCYDLSSAKNSREHNHANVLTLGAGLIGEGLAQQIVETWLATPWGPDRHARRVQKISQVEARYLCKRVEE